MKKPLITGESSPIKRYFTTKKHILLCKMNSEEDLAKKILLLYHNLDLRKKIAQGGYRVYNKYFTPRIIGNNLRKKLNSLNS